MAVASMAAYTNYVAYGVGGLFALLVIAYAVFTRNAGREDDERDQEKAIASGLRTLTRTQQTTTREPDAGFLNDVDWLARETRPAKRRRRPWQWLRRRWPRGITTHACRIEDADGRPLHVASIDGERLAHRDRDALLEDVGTVAAAKANFDTPPATMSERYYDDITDGFVDIDETRSRVRGDCLLRIQSNMRRNEELGRQELYDRLVFDKGFRYPPEIVHEKLEQLTSRDLRLRKDGTLTYQRFD